MTKASNILAKVTAIILLVIGALAFIGNVVGIINGGAEVLAIAMALILLAAGIVLMIFSKKSNLIAQIVVLGIALVIIIVDRFAVGGYLMAAVPFAYISSGIFNAFLTIFGIVMIIIMVAAIVSLVFKIIDLCKK